MAALAEDLVAGVLIDGVVASQEDSAVGHEVVEDPAGQAAGQPPGGPAALGEDAVVAGGVARGQGAEGAQEVADGAAADGQDGGQGQDDEAEEGGSGEGAGQGVEEGASRGGHGLVDALEFAASGAGLACHAAAAFAVDGDGVGHGAGGEADGWSARPCGGAGKWLYWTWEPP